MAFVKVFKLRTVFFLVVILYLLVTFIVIKVFLIKSCSTYHIHSDKSSDEFQLFYQEQPHYQNLRNAEIAESAEELDYLLNIRKLILFAVHELNEPLKYTKCTKWWANPLDLIVHKAKFVTKTYSDHLIKCRIQPGNLELEVIVRQQMTPIGVENRELEIQSNFKIQGFSGKQCGEDHIGLDVVKFCLCDDNEHFDEYHAITNKLRKIWNDTDRELITWHPDVSFFVTDYMNFTDYEWFVTSPGRTVQDVAKLKYSTEYCGPDIKMLVMVSSAPGHFERRRIIRATYARSSKLKNQGIKVVFLMGVPEDKQLNDKVKLEAAILKDIIQANFRDSYHNLTLSHLSMFKWAYLSCIGGKKNGFTVPEFILKADDDYLLILDLALHVAQQNSEYKFIGSLFCNTTAIRDVNYMHKYYTPRYMHISNSYAGYVSGVSYIMRSDIIPLIFNIAKTTPTIHMDDAYVTGILVRPLGIQPRSSKFLTELLELDLGDSCESRRMVAWYVEDINDMTEKWNMLMMPSNCTLVDVDFKLNDLTNIDRDFCLFKY